jgi:hypothetical protein
MRSESSLAEEPTRYGPDTAHVGQGSASSIPTAGPTVGRLICEASSKWRGRAQQATWASAVPACVRSFYRLRPMARRLAVQRSRGFRSTRLRSRVDGLRVDSNGIGLVLGGTGGLVGRATRTSQAGFPRAAGAGTQRTGTDIDNAAGGAMHFWATVD